MRATVDKAGRLLRDRIGLRPGEVDVRIDGAALRVEPLTSDRLVERRGRLVVPAAGAAIDDDGVRVLRQR
jgi:bifunctional DNA-binding transcriptional regulator/antitoxin component of YhaV-PrlF toxin-antitoxin module